MKARLAWAIAAERLGLPEHTWRNGWFSAFALPRLVMLQYPDESERQRLLFQALARRVRRRKFVESDQSAAFSGHTGSSKRMIPPPKRPYFRRKLDTCLGTPAPRDVAISGGWMISMRGDLAAAQGEAAPELAASTPVVIANCSVELAESKEPLSDAEMQDDYWGSFAPHRVARHLRHIRVYRAISGGLRLDRESGLHAAKAGSVRAACVVEAHRFRVASSPMGRLFNASEDFETWLHLPRRRAAWSHLPRGSTLPSVAALYPELSP